MEKKEVSKLIFYSIVLMVLTSVHHIYGAVIYETPWRLHILAVSLPMIILCLIWQRFALKERKGLNNFSSGVFGAMIFIFPIVLIGGYEGVYNHGLKNILFFGQTNEHVLQQLFPPPVYVMPNDFTFEMTGILQAVVFFPLVISFIRWARIKPFKN